MTKIASMTGIARGTVICKRGGVQPTDAEHFFKFEMCGDWFDMRDLGAALDHEEPLTRHPWKIKRSRSGATGAGRQRPGCGFIVGGVWAAPQ